MKRLSRCTPFLLAVLVFVLAWPIRAGHPSGRAAQRVASAAPGRAASVQLGDRRLDVSAPTFTPTAASGLVQASVTVTVTNTGTHDFVVRRDDFTLSAEGDMFGASGSTGTLSGMVGPGASRAGQLTFVVPGAAVPELALVYHPLGQSLVVSIPLGRASTVPPATGRMPTALSASVPLVQATVASGTIQEYSLSGGVGDPWGTAMDASGNVWFAEPGCDFAPTCSSTTPPGQLGELLAGSNTARFYTLPNIAGNQPIFVALDSAGNVWFTTPNNSMIGEFDPMTTSFVGQWPVTPGSGPWDLTFDQNGTIWYAEHLASAVGEFDPSTHTYTDFSTPSANSNPYGIAASGSLIWFTENNSSVAQIAKLDTSTPSQISEYPIRPQLPGNLTPHMIGVDATGHPWWTEGWVPDIGTLDPTVATAGQCGTVSSAGDCIGVTEVPLPPPPSTCTSSHVSGLAVQGGSTSQIWFDNSLSNQVGAYDPASNQFAVDNLRCGVHPHDGLNLDPALHVWWDEEFANALGELTQ